ncbi:MAG: hypothetical protein NVS4B5_14080 [Vulcanimicrobiaceae bacterium]
MTFSRLRLASLGAMSAVSLLAACSGGGGSAPTTAAPSKTTATAVGVTLVGRTTAFALSRHTLDVAGTPIVVTYLGMTVATGTLDKNGFAELNFTSAVPEGARVTATVGSGSNAIVATIPLAKSIAATASEVIYNPGPPVTLTVKSGDDMTGDGQFHDGENEEEDDEEDAQTGAVTASATPTASASPSAGPSASPSASPSVSTSPAAMPTVSGSPASSPIAMPT